MAASEISATASFGSLRPDSDVVDLNAVSEATEYECRLFDPKRRMRSFQGLFAINACRHIFAPRCDTECVPSVAIELRLLLRQRFIRVFFPAILVDMLEYLPGFRGHNEREKMAFFLEFAASRIEAEMKRLATVDNRAVFLASMRQSQSPVIATMLDWEFNDLIGGDAEILEAFSCVEVPEPDEFRIPRNLRANRLVVVQLHAQFTPSPEGHPSIGTSV